MQPDQSTVSSEQIPMSPAPQGVPEQMPADLSPEQQPIQWQAPEYIQEHRSPWWFISFWAIVVILMVVAVVLIKSWSFAVLIPAMAAALTIYSHRPPRKLNYVLSGKGLYINEKLHSMSEFKSFGVLHGESLPSIMLIPVKRFRPGLTIYFPVEVGEPIVDMLGSRIPMQNITRDFFDKLIHQLHL